MLLNKRQLEKLKEDWWKNDEYQAKCEKPEDQADGISIQNIGGVFIVIFVGIGMACITLIFEYWWYKYRKNTKVVQVTEATPNALHKEFNSKLGILTDKGDKTIIKNPGTNALRTRNPSFNFKSKF